MKELTKIFKSSGLSLGDTVFVHANLLSFGLVATQKEDFVGFFLDPLLEVIGETGTLAVLTYTFSYAKGESPFILEESPSEAGMLTEYVRTLPGALRSMHPLCSVTAIGPNAKKIVEGKTKTAFGFGSPFSALHQLNAKCLYLGITAGQTCTFLHYVEQMYGVSHCYNKAFFHPAYKNGELVEGPFLAFLRNRSAESYDFSSFQAKMRERNLISEHNFRGGAIQTLAFADAFSVGMEMLGDDACAFLKAPFYVTE